MQLGPGLKEPLPPVECVDVLHCDSGNGLVLSVTPSRTTIAPGDPVVFEVSLANNRSEPVNYAGGMCFTSLRIVAALPLVPPGRDDWTGRAAWFKDFALSNGYGPGGVRATDPIEIMPISDDCTESLDLDTVIHAGQRLSATFQWSGGYGSNLPVLPGEVTYRASIGYDRLNGPPTYPPGYTGVRGSWTAIYNQLGIEGRITVEGPQPSIVSAGQAIDAALADPRFASFLDAQEPDTCDLVNLIFWDTSPEGPLPPGSSWDVELFCETGVPRNFVIVHVDALTAEVKEVDVCDVPCDR